MIPWMLVQRDNSGSFGNGSGTFAMGGGLPSGNDDGYGMASGAGFNQPEEWGCGMSLGRGGDMDWGDGQYGYDFRPGLPAEPYTGQELP